MIPIRYATRNHAFAPPSTWVLDGDVLRIEEDQRPPRELPLSTIRELRLEAAPTRPDPNRYRCLLTHDRQQTVFFYNRTYAGISDFRDTSADYVVFVRTLISAVHQQAPGCRLFAGSSDALFWLNFALLVATGIGMFAAFLFFLSAGLYWWVAIDMLAIFFYTPQAISWFRSSKPRTFTPEFIPPEVLPKLP